MSAIDDRVVVPADQEMRGVAGNPAAGVAANNLVIRPVGEIKCLPVVGRALAIRHQPIADPVHRHDGIGGVGDVFLVGGEGAILYLKTAARRRAVVQDRAGLELDEAHAIDDPIVSGPGDINANPGINARRISPCRRVYIRSVERAGADDFAIARHADEVRIGKGSTRCDRRAVHIDAAPIEGRKIDKIGERVSRPAREPNLPACRCRREKRR